MEQPDNDHHSEDSRLFEEADTSVHLEKLNSFGYVIFKYWMLISFLWSIKDLIYGNGLESPESVKSDMIFMIIGFLGGLPLFIWNMGNCLVVFEGIRRKNLKMMSKVINSLELYAIFKVVFDFFMLQSENGKAIMHHHARKQYPGIHDSDLGIFDSTLFYVVLLLGWAIYYHFAFLFGAKKVRDTLKAHQRARHSL